MNQPFFVGQLIRLRHERTVVLTKAHHNQWWDCLVVEARPDASVGVGRTMSVHADDLRAGQEIVGLAAEVPSVDHLFNMFATDGWSGDAAAIGPDEFCKVIEAIYEQRMP